jgi:CBS domain-containing protein
MTTNPHTVQTGDSIRHVADVMAKQNIGAVLVNEGEKLAGIVTDRDLTIRAVAHGMNPGTTAVREVMTPNPLSVSPDASADEALETMVQRGIGRLCVVDDGRVKGVVTFGDLSALTRLVAEGLARQQQASAGSR